MTHHTTNDPLHDAAMAYHREHHGKFAIASKVALKSKDDLRLAYTPGVAIPCAAIAKDPSLAYELTAKGNMVAIVTDGSSILGLGNIGALAGMPVMEGKALLFKHLANIDAVPICLGTQDPDEIVAAVTAIAPTFGGINLEDIKAPECFEIERRLQATLSIPVMHDDQHGTAIVVMAGIINACKALGRDLARERIVINGAGAAGSAIAQLLLSRCKDIVLVDSRGIIADHDAVDTSKRALARITNPRNVTGGLAEALDDATIFIGVSRAGLLTPALLSRMASAPIIFGLANPIPEIMPDVAKRAGAALVATGRSDFPNQVNNALAFPGVFRGALDARARRITREMQVAAAMAIADSVEPTIEQILPDVLDPRVVPMVAAAVRAAYDPADVRMMQEGMD